jgi:hypothetical protein
MKVIAKTRNLAPRRRTTTRTRPAAPSAVASPAKLTDEEFRRQLHLELAAEIAAARKAAKKRFGHLLRPHTPDEIKARSAAVRAMFASWEQDNRKNPVSREESESYDRMLARMAAERAG